MSNKNFTENFSFSEFKAIPKANLLIKKSREKRIEPKVMSLLILLASKHGDVVTRQEILDSLWPNMVVGDEVISQLIYSLRNALADDAKNPQYIETISKKGYRFIAEVNAVESEVKGDTSISAELTTNPLTNSKKMSLKNKWLVSSGLTVLIGFIAWFISNLFLQNNVNALTVKNILPVTKSMGVEGDFSFHESHQKMVYVHSQDPYVDLYLKVLGENKSQQLTNDEWIESSPLWIDAETLVYIRKKANLYQIIRHQLKKETEILYESQHYIFNLAIKTDEESAISFIEYDKYQHGKLTEIKSLSLLNNKVSYLHDSVLNLPINTRYQVYSLDGQRLYLYDNSNRVKKVLSLALKSNQYTTITQEFTWIHHIALFDSEHLLISGQLSATRGIWLLNINDHSIKSILPTSGDQKVVRALLNQGQIYYATYKTSSNQFIADIKQQTLDPLPELNSGAYEFHGIFSKDNKTIYFVSNRTGYYEIWSYDANTQTTKQVTQLQANFIYRPALSNKEDLFAVVYNKGELTLAIISLKTGKPVNEKNIPSMKFPLTWSQDDKSIYISEHNKQVNIYQYNSTTLEPKLIQTHAGLFAQESADGEKLTLVDYKAGGLINKNLTTGKITKLNNSIANLESLSPGVLETIEQSIFVVESNGAARKIQKYSRENDEQKTSGTLLMALPDSSRVTDFNLDGSKAIFSKNSPPEGDIMTIKLGS